MKPIDSSSIAIQGVGQVQGVKPAFEIEGNKASKLDFTKLLANAFQQTNKAQLESDQVVAGLLKGEHANLHETAIALEKADLSIKLLTKVTGQVIKAYNEVMRMGL